MKKNDEKGMVMVIVVIFGAIAIMLGTALLTTSVLEVKSGNYHENDAQAYFIAKSGAEIIEKAIIEGDIIVDTDNSTVQTFTGTIGTNDYAVEVNRDSIDSTKIIIDSVGNTKGVDDEVRLNLKENSSSSNSSLISLKYSIFSNGFIDIKKGVITGNIGTNSTQNNSVKLKQNTTIDGTVYVGFGGDPNRVINAEVEPLKGTLSQQQSYITPELPSLPNITYIPSNDENFKDGSLKIKKNSKLDLRDKDIKLHEIKIQGGKLTIDVGDRDAMLLVEDFITEWNDSDLVIDGNGSLSIYITKTLDLKKVREYNWSDTIGSQRLKIYYYGKSHVKLGGSRLSNINAMLYVKEARINMPKCNFNGNIYSASSKKIVMANDQACTLNGSVYAPLANVNVYKQNINGHIIADKITVHGDQTVHINASTTNIEVPVQSGGGGGSDASYERVNFE